MTDTTQPPVLRVLRGNPDVDEVAVLAALVTSAAAHADEGGQPAALVSQWASVTRQLHINVRPGPTGWLDSALPR